MPRKFALTVAYDGSRYAGWQIQPNGLSIQQVLAEAISGVVGHEVQVTGSGRTDAGVHACGQVCSFATDAWNLDAAPLVPAINRNLPRDITVIDSRAVIDSFDPIRNALGKRYRYLIRSSRVPDPMGYSHHWWLPRPLDLESMRAGAERLIGTHDFKAFESLGSNRKTSIRTVRELCLYERDALAGKEIVIEIEANGFLYNMVRNITGALVEIGKGRFQPERLDHVVASRARDTQSQTAPARGLCLLQVDYPDHLFLPGNL